MCGKNRDCRNEDLETEFGVEVPSLCSLSFGSLGSAAAEELFIRKKFLIFCETWLLEPLTGRLFESGAPLKVRFSAGIVGWLDEEPNRCVVRAACVPAQTR